MTSFNSVFGGAFAGPGINAPLENVENEFYWNNHYSNRFSQGVQFDSTTVDSGNTVTTVLRPGLLLGMIYSTGKVIQWSPTATDGSQYIWGILNNPGLAMTDSLGTAKARFRGGLMIQGAIKPKRLLIPGQAAFGIAGNAYEFLIRAQLRQRGFMLLDDPVSDSILEASRFMWGFNAIQAKTADYTVKNYESGTLFTTRGAGGAVIFTLPATPSLGLFYGFTNVADQSMSVISSGSSDNLISFNDAGADSVAFSTSSEKIGGSFIVLGDGTSWLVYPFNFGLGATAQTVTTA